MRATRAVILGDQFILEIFDIQRTVLSSYSSVKFA